jgi:CRISPR-associated protein Cas2
MHTEFTVIAFDVADDKRRRRLVNVLESFGVRAQESVFEAWLTERERNKLLYQANKQIKADRDRLVIYVLPPSDFADIVSLGLGKVAEDFKYLIF